MSNLTIKILTNEVRKIERDLERADITVKQLEYSQMMLQRAKNGLIYLEQDGDEDTAWGYFLGVNQLPIINELVFPLQYDVSNSQLLEWADYQPICSIDSLKIRKTSSGHVVSIVPLYIEDVNEDMCNKLQTDFNSCFCG